MPDEEVSKDDLEIILIPNGKASSVARKYFMPSTSSRLLPGQKSRDGREQVEVGLEEEPDD